MTEWSFNQAKIQCTLVSAHQMWQAVGSSLSLCCGLLVRLKKKKKHFENVTLALRYCDGQISLLPTSYRINQLFPTLCSGPPSDGPKINLRCHVMINRIGAGKKRNSATHEKFYFTFSDSLSAIYQQMTGKFYFPMSLKIEIRKSWTVCSW